MTSPISPQVPPPNPPEERDVEKGADFSLSEHLGDPGMGVSSSSILLKENYPNAEGPCQRMIASVLLRAVSSGEKGRS